MKKRILLLAAAALMLTVAACGKKDTPAAGNAAAENKTTAAAEESKAPAGSGAAAADSAKNAESTEPEPAIPGKLNFITLKEGEEPILKGLRLYGNRVGDAAEGAGFNDRPAAAEDIRCIFELNEWVEVFPDTAEKKGIRLWVMKHREDQKSYEKAVFSDMAPDFVTYLDLEENADDAEACWGSFYLSPDDCEPGYYDFVFVHDKKVIATMVTRFYNDGELQGKPDSELEKLMAEEISAAGK